MEPSFKQSVGSVINWKRNIQRDEFLIARVKLTFFYTLTATIILGAASVLLYKQLLSKFFESLHESHIDPLIKQALFDVTQDKLLNDFILIDIGILIVVVLLGFLLSEKTLKPIRQNADRQKRFIADASHELRTPIAVIISGIEVALRNKRLDVVGATEVLHRTLDEAKELSQLSNQLLDVSTQGMRIAPQALGMHEFFVSLGTKISMLTADKNITLTLLITHNAIVQGDRLALERVFFNIISNAITHTPNGGTITLKDSLSGTGYTVSVTDTGSGIPRDVLQKVFDPFFRADASRHTQGAGLGLTLAKKIIEEHGGTITLTSKVGQGTMVTITLPVSS